MEIKRMLELGARPLALEDLGAVCRESATVGWKPETLARIGRGRGLLLDRIAAGERVYGVNTGIGTNIKFDLAADQTELLQSNLLRQLSCATGQPLPDDVVRGALLLRLATFATGTSAVRPELCEALTAILNAGITPVVPRYGSVGASGDLMPSAYVARVLLGMGDVRWRGVRMSALDAMAEAGIPLFSLASKEGLALINGTTVMTSVAALITLDAFAVLRALLSAVALSVEAVEASFQPFEAFPHAQKGHPGQIAVAAFLREQFAGSGLVVDSSKQSCYSLRCVPQGLGPVWEALENARALVEREMNSANDNPLIDPDSGEIFRAGNFYGGHISRLLDTFKIDFAIEGNWANALMAVLVDDRFSNGLPACLVREPGVNSGFKGMQLSVTSLACAIRQMSAPSSIHSLPTEQYNQDVVSLGMHSAVTAMDALDCLRNEVAMVLLAAAQAVDLRGCVGRLGAGTRKAYAAVRSVAAVLEGDRPMEHEIAAVSELIRSM